MYLFVGMVSGFLEGKVYRGSLMRDRLSSHTKDPTTIQGPFPN